MSDPVTPIVGTVAAIASLVKAAKGIYSWISDFRNAPEYVSELRLFILAFTIFVEGVQRSLRDPNIARKVPPEQTNIIVGNAKETLHQLKLSLGQVAHGFENDVSRSKWLQYQHKCRDLQKRLTLCRDSLVGIINVAQSESLRIFGERMHVILHMEEARLLEFNSQAVNEFSGNADLLLMEAPSSERPSTLDLVLSSDVHIATKGSQSAKDGDGGSTLVSQKSESNAANVQYCTKDCACVCHTEQKPSPPELVAKRKSSTSNFLARFVRSCSIRACMKKKRRTRGTYVVPAKLVNEALRTSLIARGFHNLFFMRIYNEVPETSDSLRYVNSGNLQALKLLIQTKRATVDDRAPDGWSLLHNAAYYGSLDIVLYLIKMRADVKVGEIGARKASDLARIRAFHKNATSVQHQIAQAFNNDDDVKFDFGFTPIHIAVLDAYDKDDTDRPHLSELLSCVEDANNAPKGQNWIGWRRKYLNRSPLFAEIIEEFYEASVQAKRSRDPRKPYLRLIDKRDERQGWTPFLWAAYTGRLEEMNILLEHDADPFLISPMNRNALHQAAESKSPEIMERVLKIPPYNGEWFDINAKDKWGETALHIAAEGSAESVKLLLEYGARRDLGRIDNKTPLHLASHAKGDERYKIMDILSSDKGQHINMQDESGKPAIFDVLDTPSCVELLLNCGASISLRDNEGRSVMHHACMESQPESLKVLLGAAEVDLATSPDLAGDVPLAKAFEFKSAQCVKILLEFDAIGNMNEKDGMTLAHRAADLGDPEVLKCVFEHASYKRGLRDAQDRSVLEVANAASTFKGKVRELILHYESRGTEVDAKGKRKSTNTGLQIEPSSNEEAARAFYFSTLR